MFTASLAQDLLTSLHDPGIDAPKFGQADFTGASFTGEASFRKAHFIEDASFARVVSNGEMLFQSATFHGTADFSEAKFNLTRFADTTFSQDVNFHDVTIQDAWFFGATFSAAADFDGAICTERASFGRATFSGYTSFSQVTFSDEVAFHESKFSKMAEFTDVKFGGEAYFDRAVFANYAHFSGATFEGPARFAGVSFNSGARFDGARFHGTQSIGPLICRDKLDLSMALFSGPATIEAVAMEIACKRTEWQATGTFRFRRARLDLTDAVFTQPFSISSSPVPFRYQRRYPLAREHDFVLDESSTTWRQGTSSICSLRGVDCSMLSFSDVDLRICRFAGALHLDQLHLEGRWTLQAPPEGRVHKLFPLRWAQRQVIEEERRWRALPTHPAFLRARWGGPPGDMHDVPGLATLTAIYRQLRKAREDAKDEPGAADFYYGEMEMRRHGQKWNEAERWLLQLYWLLSGYGLRASRALGWLTFAMMATIILMMGIGLPQDSPKQQVTGTVPPSGGKVTFEIDKDDPKNATHDRFTVKRFDKALTVTLNSVVFRSSDQDLTTAGGYIEMASRFSEPVLLGLAALAIRGRVKR
ncbi:pentapeptide repeat-containing protein [Streptomyces qinglanensis]|uniref:pentapeptide repeat-containing protein n=1 Tax=Streptomyces qinglanensis TaxID=943816 RepID=UPI001EF7D8AE|nr:pentapeptide repeat-containing protein [Streptomyces qinglanensis]